MSNNLGVTLRASVRGCVYAAFQISINMLIFVECVHTSTVPASSHVVKNLRLKPPFPYPPLFFFLLKVTLRKQLGSDPYRFLLRGRRLPVRRP